ncbi:Pentatricopeptide repeat-containing protein, mitochondrial [Capsicum baccatum]|uniref:Pentatricopeptide repeat-containing protein, mitochondrial n=1 Tax=Capsicum baccatum TaxID=33114 RepID=A0A2G2VCC6_CAPBA|nr:Pentatricopeptide repeat-containing protein, mitochondrial [Capsicum baccatum]
MAARSIFLTLTRNVRGRERSLFRSFTTTTEVVYEDSPDSAVEEKDETVDDLKSRIFSVRLPKRSATNVLQRWVGEGRQVSISDLRHISKELRKSRRFKHALEVNLVGVVIDFLKYLELTVTPRHQFGLPLR